MAPTSSTTTSSICNCPSSPRNTENLKNNSSGESGSTRFYADFYYINFSAT